MGDDWTKAEQAFARAIWADMKQKISDTRGRVMTQLYSGEPLKIVLDVLTKQEADGRWIAWVLNDSVGRLIAYGETEDEAVMKAEAIALRMLAYEIEHG